MLSGKGNEKGERTTMCLISKKATLHVQCTFLYIFSGGVGGGGGRGGPPPPPPPPPHWDDLRFSNTTGILQKKLWGLLVWKCSKRRVHPLLKKSWIRPCFLPLFCMTTIWNFQKLPSYTFYGGNVVRVLALPDADLEIRDWGQSSKPLEKGGGWGRSPKNSKKIFSALRASVWSKNKGEPGPLPWIRHFLALFFFFTVAHFHPWWPRAYLIFSPPLQNFHVVLPTKNDSFVFYLSPTFSLSLSFSFPIF